MSDKEKQAPVPPERPTIFISSVTDGLASYRRLVAKIVRGNGYRTEVQDDFEIRGDRVEDMIREKIRASQGVICLLGPSYGQPSPMRAGDYYLSYSQMELVMAYQYGKPRYIFLAQEEALRGARKPEPPEHTALQAAFIENLRTQDGRQLYYRFKGKYTLLKLLATAQWERWLRNEELWR